jgi:methylenetetrahydrofolate reductase (NADPH)
LPEDLIQAVEGCKTNADIKTVGIEWAIQQSLELKAAGVPVYIIILWGNQRILNK